MHKGEHMTYAINVLRSAVIALERIGIHDQRITDLEAAIPADAACPVSEWPAKISAAAGGTAATTAPAPAKN